MVFRAWLTVPAALFCALFSVAQAQWLKYPTPGIPRTKDGKPDLSAPAPRTPDGKPDLSGIWGQGGRPPDIQGIPLQPQARASVEQFQKEQINNKDTILARCLPTFFNHLVPIALYKIVQTPSLVVILADNQGMPLPRQIFLDGRPLPENPNPTWMGYSVGRWDGNALVVETIGFNDRGIVPGGIPMTETTRVIERYERIDFGHMKLRITMDDPKTFTKPWTFDLTPQLQPDTEILEWVCEKNDDILRHMVGPR